MNEKWFNWYVSQATKEKKWAKYRDRYLCPCCYMPTLDERCTWDICPICFWKDDGQDSDDAKIIRGGPNSNYSLEEARKNFYLYHTMYRPSDENAFNCEQKNISIKKKMYQAFSLAIESNTDSDWGKALKIEEEY